MAETVGKTETKTETDALHWEPMFADTVLTLIQVIRDSGQRSGSTDAQAETGANSYQTNPRAEEWKIFLKH